MNEAAFIRAFGPTDYCAAVLRGTVASLDLEALGIPTGVVEVPDHEPDEKPDERTMR